MTKPKSWTLKSIAKELGVSNATVSNAFNRPDQLSKARREEILAACKKLGYFGPNKAAQSLRRGTFNIVALVLPDSVEYMVSDPVASSFMRGVSAVLEKNGINLLLFSGNNDNLNSVVDFVDGFICYGRPRNKQLVEQLKQVAKHVVTVDFNIGRDASVNVNNHQASFDIAKHALQKNDDRVAILGLRLLDNDVLCRVYEHHEFEAGQSIAHQRLRGYLQAINDAGITLGDDRTWNIPESSERFASIAAKEALSSTPRPNVLLCMSDLIALAAMREALKMGLSIPEDIRIVGFDGIDEGQRFVPKLTTVHQNSEEKGRIAATLFLSKEQQTAEIDYQLQLGQSS
ncbi:LacI family DNA-binding transcriptional regulator [Pseudoalteromonas arabiensis]|uniref:LacI family DNA-binding transcriptional regulator n=1 Tax=Pseudoalteromonas arabiensis TaxID=874454 RepID=UPI0007803C5F|nr:LacI family DNA-binding transcriptional regulator [Pseudoalteromonas arabiensis]